MMNVKLRKMADGLVAVSVALVFAVTAQAKVYYVDPVNGSDDYDGSANVWQGGTSKVGPKETLYGVASIAKNSGDIIHAAEGSYTNKTTGKLSKGGGTQNGYYRAELAAGVKLVASGARDKTFIIGRPDPDVVRDASPYGCGANASRGLYLNSKAVVKGFTITGCYGSQGWSSSYYGGAVNGSGYVIDCVITNNVAPRGAGLCDPTAIRCRFSGNRGNWTGTDMQGGHSFSCSFSSCNGGSNIAGGRHYNCSFTHEASTIGTFTALYNCYLTKVAASGSGCMTNCLTTYAKQVSAYGKMGAGSAVVSGSDLALDGTFCPKRTSVAVNRGVDSYYDDAFPSDDLPNEKDFDLKGNPRKVGTTIDVGPFENQNPCPGHFYVDAKNGDDAKDGESLANAKRSLAAVCAIDTLLSGDTIHAAAGVYDAGVMTNSTAYRIVVPEGVTVVADEGRDATWIVGAGDSTSGNACGLGSKAVRCAYLNDDSLLIGFCLTNGVTTADGFGGAACGSSSGYLVDCEIVDCRAYRGGGVKGVGSIGCLFHDNLTTYTGGDAYEAHGFYGCVFGTSYALVAGKQTATYNLYACSCDVVNCTFVGTGTHSFGTATTTTRFYNCLFTKEGGGFGCGITNCVNTVNWSKADRVSSDSFVTTEAALKLDDDKRPLSGSVAIDRGTNAYLDLVPAKVRDCFLHLDDPAKQRIYNGTVDLGAYEYDWRGDYAKRLSGRAMVTRATTNVMMSANGPVVAGGQTLEGTLAVQAGGCSYALTPTVSGDGTLTVLADGQPLAAENGVYKFVAEPSAETLVWSIRFDGTGSATLPRFIDGAGFLMIIR